MQYCRFVYLIKSQNRLVILNSKSDNSDYIELMSNYGNTPEVLDALCKTFCGAFIMGCRSSTTPINDMGEFRI
jgi:hypothetical protein